MTFSRFKLRFSRPGTVVPEGDPLAKYPAVREHVHDLKGVVLYSPLTKFVFTLTGPGQRSGGDAIIIHGSDLMPRGGYNAFVDAHELQRCLRVMLDVAPAVGVGDAPLPRVELAETADGHLVKVLREPEVIVEPEVGEGRIPLGENSDDATINPDTDIVWCQLCAIPVIGPLGNARYDHIEGGPICWDRNACGQRTRQGRPTVLMECVACGRDLTRKAEGESHPPVGRYVNGRGLLCRDREGCVNRLLDKSYGKERV